MKVNAIHFTKRAGEKIYIQVYDAIKEDILAGYMKYGDQLPSIRVCAKMLSLSRTSIEAAYQRLLLEGYIISKAQRGYFVDVDEKNARLRNDILQIQPSQKPAKTYIDLRSHSIDASSFDRTIWMHYLKDVLEDEEAIMSYGDPQGELPLRSALQKYVYAMRGVLAREEDIVVGASFQSLLYLICSLYDGPLIVGMEQGGFIQAEQVFQDCRISVSMLACDAYGITLEALENSTIGMLYLNTASCGTQKKALCSTRREAILTWAKQHNVLILEDDHNGELRYSSKMRPAMQGFDLGEQVIYLRSFSKLVLPSLRISFMVLNKELSKRYQRLKYRYNASASKIEQMVLASYIRDGHLERQIRRLRKRYEEKCRRMLEALHTYLPDVACIVDESALLIQLQFPYPIDIDTYLKLARQANILLQRMASDDLAISFAAVASEEIPTVIQRLTNAWSVEKNIDQ